ncbi:F/Y rich C-terminus-domain-containing protein [Gongronella butleri]|nr:F/Y rich C-terminus-domain-containing protein [Gongronella butleri]
MGTCSMKSIPVEEYVLMKRRLDEMAKTNEHLTNDLDQANKRLRRLAHEKNILLDRISTQNSNDDVLTAIKNEELTPTPPPCGRKDLHMLDAQPPPSLLGNGTSGSSSDSSNDPSTPVPAMQTTLPSLSASITLPLPQPGLKKPIPLPPTSSLLPPPPPQNGPNASSSSASLMPTTSISTLAPPTSSHPNMTTTSPPLGAPPLPPSANATANGSATTSTTTTTIRNGSAFKDVSLLFVKAATGHTDQDPYTNSSSNTSVSPPPSLDATGANCTMVPSSRPKRMRRGNQEPKLRRVQPLQRDRTGRYCLPVRVGILTVHALGRIVPLTTYHNDRYIWPPGFKVSRTYLSMVNFDQNTVYTCTVEENGEQGPRFRVVAEDCPDQPIVANSATGVWTAIVKRANEIRNREHSNSASGPDYYGFTHATIAKMIQDLPGADQCLNYVWQKFGEMHHRTAAGVAAAAQKKLANLEIMGSANKRAPPPLSDGFVLNDNYQNSGNNSSTNNGGTNSSSTAPAYSPSSTSSSSSSSSSSSLSFKTMVNKQNNKRRRPDDAHLPHAHPRPHPPHPQNSHAHSHRHTRNEEKGFMRMKLSPTSSSLPTLPSPNPAQSSLISTASTASPTLPSLAAITTTAVDSNARMLPALPPPSAASSTPTTSSSPWSHRT